jgi:hypothetical protein
MKIKTSGKLTFMVKVKKKDKDIPVTGRGSP